MEEHLEESAQSHRYFRLPDTPEPHPAYPPQHGPLGHPPPTLMPEIARYSAPAKPPQRRQSAAQNPVQSNHLAPQPLRKTQAHPRQSHSSPAAESRSQPPQHRTRNLQTSGALAPSPKITGIVNKRQIPDKHAIRYPSCSKPSTPLYNVPVQPRANTLQHSSSPNEYNCNAQPEVVASIDNAHSNIAKDSDRDTREPRFSCSILETERLAAPPTQTMQSRTKGASPGRGSVDKMDLPYRHQKNILGTQQRSSRDAGLTASAHGGSGKSRNVGNEYRSAEMTQDHPHGSSSHAYHGEASEDTRPENNKQQIRGAPRASFTPSTKEVLRSNRFSRPARDSGIESDTMNFQTPRSHTSRSTRPERKAPVGQSPRSPNRHHPSPAFATRENLDHFSSPARRHTVSAGSTATKIGSSRRATQSRLQLQQNEPTSRADNARFVAATAPSSSKFRPAEKNIHGQWLHPMTAETEMLSSETGTATAGSSSESSSSQHEYQPQTRMRKASPVDIPVSNPSHRPPVPVRSERGRSETRSSYVDSIGSNVRNRSDRRYRSTSKSPQTLTEYDYSLAISPPRSSRRRHTINHPSETSRGGTADRVQLRSVEEIYPPMSGVDSPIEDSEPAQKKTTPQDRFQRNPQLSFRPDSTRRRRTEPTYHPHPRPRFSSSPTANTCNSCKSAAHNRDMASPRDLLREEKEQRLARGNAPVRGKHGEHLLCDRCGRKDSDTAWYDRVRGRRLYCWECFDSKVEWHRDYWGAREEMDREGRRPAA